MQENQPERDDQAHQCGRLFAVLEEIQRRASESALNKGVVDRFYGSASTAPGAYLPNLLKLAKTAHLPKIRNRMRGYKKLEGLVTEIMSRINNLGGFPGPLKLRSQAEFGLGYYQQKADLRKAEDKE